LTTKRAPRRKVAPSQPGAIFVLVLGAWMHPALSATDANTRCDQSIDAPAMAAAANNKLAIQVVDHGMNTAAGTDDISPEETAADQAAESSDRRAAPRVDIMRQRIFDEVPLQQPQLSESEQPDGMRGSLAIDKTKVVEEPAAVNNTDQTDGADELPEFSGDEVLRYRQQMYRKDI